MKLSQVTKKLGGKPAPKSCKLFRLVCWIPNPPHCSDCKHNEEVKENETEVPALSKAS